MRRRGADDGVFAILYALLVLALVGTAAVVVDLALLRESRASTRSAADSAVLAAATSLNPIQPSLDNPRAGCQRAWKYLMGSLGGPGPNQLHDGSATCAAFPLPPIVTPCSTPPIAASSTGFGWTVRVTWPVPDASDLLSNPDLAPASVAQGIDADFDGTDPCARVGLEVLKTNAPIFAGVFGAGAVQTRAASVARGTGQDGSRKVIAGLNILEGTGCEALTTTDRGSINVNGTGGDAGVIAVESDGSTCNTGGAVIRPRDNPDSTIRSSGPDGVGDGLIQSFALNPAPTGNPSKAFINASRLFPQPTVMANRFGDGPVRSLFNCTSGRCPPGGGPWIEELRDKYAGPGQPLAFTTLPGAAVPTFNCNQDVVTVVPAGNWFLDCPGGLNVSTTLIFQGGVVVTTSAININRGGCLAVNVPATTCPLLDTAASPVTTNPAPTGDAILYVRAGRLFKDERASLYLPQTFTYLGNGSTDLQGRSGTLVMTTPLASGCGADAACSNRRFKRLVLWSEADQIHRMAGQSSLALRGVFFTPNAASTFVALRSGQNQTAAQFWTRTLVVGGRDEFVMSPDPDAAVPRPLEALGSVALIR